MKPCDMCAAPFVRRAGKFCSSRCYRAAVVARTKREIIERFLARYEPEPNSGCWLWIGSVSGHGYGRFHSGKVSFAAHRFSYEVSRGHIPEQLELDHLCRVRMCVNPSHLEPVPHRENVLRGHGFAAIHAKKNACVSGHPLDGRYAGRRRCRTCDRMRHARARAVKKALDP
jgi:hypothetical protein